MKEQDEGDGEKPAENGSTDDKSKEESNTDSKPAEKSGENA